MNDIQFYDLEFVEKYGEYDAIYTFLFSPVQEVPFKAGQWIHLGFLTPDRDKAYVRHMSFASAPGDKYVAFTMDIGSGTPYKKRMDGLGPGDIIKGFKIKGEFVIDPVSKTEVVFLSGGIGITPVRSLIRNLNANHSPVKWSLCHVSRGGFLYEKELTALGNEQWRVNRVGLDSIWEQVVNKPSDVAYYVSGSERFVEGMKEKLATAGVTADQIKTESFH